MLRNQLVIAFRNFTRQFSYSLINLTGLAIGLACSLVIFIYVYGEWSYDRHFANADRIYKVGIGFFNMPPFGIGPEALGEFLPAEYAGIEAFTRVSNEPREKISVGNQVYQDVVYYTDSSFFKVFSYDFVEGDREHVLNHPDQIVITQKIAEKYFKNEDAMGKTILIGKEKKPFIVAGVVKDDARNSQLRSSIWLSIDQQLTHEPLWTSASYYNYILLKKGNTQDDLENALDRLLKNKIYAASRISPMGVPANLSFEEYKKHPNSIKFFVNALQDVHLKSRLTYEISPGGSESNMKIFAIVAAFILSLASVNFVNLTTARASRRAKEVGIRKVVGSSRSKLAFQFLLESVIMSVVAMAISLIIAQGFLEVFKMITGNQLVNTLWSGVSGIAGVFTFAVMVGILSGIYPAFYLTSFKPVSVLKGNLSVAGGSRFRDFLVVTQFSVSICLLICTFVIVRQMNYLQNKDLGFDQRQVLTVDNLSLLGNHIESFKNEMRQQAGVSAVSLHSGEPGSKSIISFSSTKSDKIEAPINISSFFADPGYVEVMGLHLIEGRDFNKDLASDSVAVILNESAVKALNLDHPVGSMINGGMPVIGVVRDFHWESLRSQIAPVSILPTKSYQQLGIRLTSESAASVVKAAEAKWKTLVPGEPFNYHFLDENFGAMLRQEQIFEKAISFFTAMAVLISCLGLYGLSAYTTSQRRKEISIRKVLGANASSIVALLNKKFTLLVAIAALIASPVAAYAMTEWTSGFAYKTEIQVWLFIGAIGFAFMIALGTVSFHAIKAAFVNPAETLKHE